MYLLKEICNLFLLSDIVLTLSVCVYMHNGMNTFRIRTGREIQYSTCCKNRVIGYYLFISSLFNTVLHIVVHLMVYINCMCTKEDTLAIHKNTPKFSKSSMA